MNKSRLLKRLILALLLGIATWALIAFSATKLPYSQARDEITDAASIPAVLMSWIIYPEGVHTGMGAPLWGVVFLCSGILFYAIVWFVVLSTIARRKSLISAGSGRKP